MCTAAKSLVWLGLSMLAFGGWPELALSCGGDMRQDSDTPGMSPAVSDSAHAHHASGAVERMDAAFPDGNCCGDCVALCASAGVTPLLSPVAAGNPHFERYASLSVPSDALPPSPPPPVLFRPPIQLA